MTGRTDWLRVKDVFRRALDQPPEHRERWLIDACDNDEAFIAEVRSLLGAHDAPDALAGGIAELMSPLTAQEILSPDVGTQIGAYKLVRLLGAGGMGRVYLAERVDGQFKHQIALKLIRGELIGPELGSRFLRERETLSQLHHPNIAQLHDGGVTSEGEPYFTLEFVDGEPITKWCDAHRSSIRERVRLMLKVCDAVDHAHRNLIVHRDIKPSNILVGANGEPKLLDFGIAKPLEGSPEGELTADEVRPMTREYAAPEQVLGERVTTATDVYSIGVLLYLLLCGRMPYRKAAAGLSTWPKSILEEQPESLTQAVFRTTTSDADGSSAHDTNETDANALAARRSLSIGAFAKSLRGDLNRIVQRAMAKSPLSRYPNVAALVADLNAYLDDRAISGGTRTYRARKFVAKYWLPIAAAASLVLVIFVSSIVMVIDARKIEREAKTTSAVKQFLIELFNGADPIHSLGKDITARDLVSRGVARITSMQDQPLLRGELESILGAINNNLEQYSDAERLQLAAMDDLSHNGGPPSLIASTEFEYANSIAKAGKDDEAQIAADKAIADLRALDPPAFSDLTAALTLRSYIAISMHDFKNAAMYADQAMAVARDSSVPKDRLAEALSVSAQSAGGQHDREKEEALLREALDVRRSSDGEDIYVATAMANLATASGLHGGEKEALELLEKATQIATRAVGDKDPRLAYVRSQYADILRVYGRFKEAAEQLELNDRYEATLTDETARLGSLSQHLALAISQGHYDEAARYVDQMTELADRLFGAPSPMQEQFSLDRCEILLGQERLDDAEALYADTPPSKHGHGSSGTTRTMVSQEIDQRRGRFDKAKKTLEDALAKQQFGHGRLDMQDTVFRTALGKILGKMGDFANAESTLRGAVEIYEKSTGGVIIPASSHARLELAEVLSQTPSKKSEALALAKSVYEADSSFFGTADPRTKRAKAIIDHL